MKILNYFRQAPVLVAVLVWAAFVTVLIFFVKPRTVYVETEPEIVTVTETVEVVIEPENNAYYKDISLTDEEWILVGKIVYAEAGNQTQLGRRCIVEVIFNRVLDDRFPDTVTDVILQSNQFTEFEWVDEETARAQFGCIEDVLNEVTPVLRSDIVYFATYKNANGTHYERIGSHYFGY